ncbi:MAG: NADH-quinone oxidoreductase subunit N [Verrucomicrobiales bacterium]|nr:NADH-quinone oxidoreductase subunit N [Verrucomicrobiales bacterium]
MNFNYVEVFKFAIPEMIVSVAALAVLAMDLAARRGRSLGSRTTVAAAVSVFGCVAAMAWTTLVSQPGTLLDGALVVSPLTQFVKAILLGLTAVTALISIQNSFTEHVGEYFALLLFATVGMLFLVSSENLLMIFLSLEFTSLSLYILVAFNKQSITSAEAALKYFLFGGMSAAFTLFGLSLIYGLTGEINLTAIAAGLRGRTNDTLFLAALVLTVIGFGFKIAAVPFHLWAPDAYQGAPTPSAALIASGSKVASFFILARVMTVGFAGAEGSGEWRNFLAGWMPVLAVLAALSMLLGNLAAIVQTSVKRLLGYSAIAHAGYMILGVMVTGHGGREQPALVPLLYYVTTYALTTVGAFGVVTLVESRMGNDKLSSFAGLSRTAPFISFCMMIFMLSLAGIPPLAGFVGKFYLFVAAVGAAPQQLGLLWLVVLAIATSAVSLYYYLQVLKQIYVVEAPADSAPVQAPGTLQWAVALAALIVVFLGCMPNFLLEPLLSVIRMAGL